MCLCMRACLWRFGVRARHASTSRRVCVHRTRRKATGNNEQDKIVIPERNTKAGGKREGSEYTRVGGRSGEGHTSSSVRGWLPAAATSEARSRTRCARAAGILPVRWRISRACPARRCAGARAHTHPTHMRPLTRPHAPARARTHPHAPAHSWTRPCVLCAAHACAMRGAHWHSESCGALRGERAPASCAAPTASTENRTKQLSRQC
jgi:hypothetical protein